MGFSVSVLFGRLAHDLCEVAGNIGPSGNYFVGSCDCRSIGSRLSLPFDHVPQLGLCTEAANANNYRHGCRKDHAAGAACVMANLAFRPINERTGTLNISVRSERGSTGGKASSAAVASGGARPADARKPPVDTSGCGAHSAVWMASGDRCQHINDVQHQWRADHHHQ